jgi:hypothetical protein
MDREISYALYSPDLSPEERTAYKMALLAELKKDEELTRKVQLKRSMRKVMDQLYQQLELYGLSNDQVWARIVDHISCSVSEDVRQKVV